MLQLRNKLDQTELVHSFEVIQHATYSMLYLSDGTPFAQANELISKAIGSILELPSVYCTAFANNDACERIFSRAKRPAEAILKVEINVYGEPERSDDVGKRLMNAKVYLQDPDHGIEGIEYNNPHLFRCDSIPEALMFDLGQQNSTTHASEPENNEGNLDETLSQIYKSLTRFRSLELTSGGAQVLTPLLE